MMVQPFLRGGLWGLFLLMLGACQAPSAPRLPQGDTPLPPFSLEELQKRTFAFFWDYSDNPFAQTLDRAPTETFYSIAATGFGLTSYLIGVEKGYISREAGASRSLKCLEQMWQMQQHDGASGASGYRGFFYHFLTLEGGKRYKDVELSTIDTGLLMAGVLSAQVYFDGSGEKETRIRNLADSLYRRVEWNWAMNERGHMSMGWRPESGFISYDWQGYNEAMILLILALGSPTHPIPAEAWPSWCDTYAWETFEGYPHVNFSPLFGHQYSQMYIDFRDIYDPYMREKGIDYAENSRRATLTNRAYCMRNPRAFTGYDSLSWGLTACDGPRDTLATWQGEEVRFHSYSARGASVERVHDDGTLAPTAVGGSIPFAPEVCLPTLAHLWDSYGDRLVGPYGFRDAFNPSYTWGYNSKDQTSNAAGWFDLDYLGIDQGPILLQSYNHQTGFVWELMKKSPYIRKGLLRADFSGGWLSER